MPTAFWSAPLPDEQEQKKEEEKKAEVVTPGQTDNTPVATDTKTDQVVVPTDNTDDNTPQPTLVEPVYKTTAQDEYKANNPKPEQSTYNANMEALKSLTPPLSDEERAKRQRAASAVETIGHLGNAASAIANLIGVHNGARPQTIPQVDLSTKQEAWRKEMDAQRQSHAAALAQARNADYHQYRQAIADWYTGYKIAADSDAKAYEAWRNAENDAINKVYKLGGLAVRRDNADIARIRANASMLRAQKFQGGRSGGSGSNAYVWLGDGDGGRKRYKQKEMMDRNVITNLYNELMQEHPEYNASPGREYVVGKGWIDKTPKVDDMRYAVWEAVENGDYAIPSEYEIGGASGGTSGGDNTPPGRRKANNDNRPPSRRE